MVRKPHWYLCRVFYRFSVLFCFFSWYCITFYSIPISILLTDFLEPSYLLKQSQSANKKSSFAPVRSCKYQLPHQYCYLHSLKICRRTFINEQRRMQEASKKSLPWGRQSELCASILSIKRKISILFWIAIWFFWLREYIADPLAVFFFCCRSMWRRRMWLQRWVPSLAQWHRSLSMCGWLFSGTF